MAILVCGPLGDTQGWGLSVLQNNRDILMPVRVGAGPCPAGGTWMAAHPGCWSRPADNLAPSARGAKCLVCDAVHTGQGSAGAGGVRRQNAAKTEPPPAEAPCRGLLCPSLTTAPCPPRGEAQGCREMHHSPRDKCGQMQPSTVGGAGPRKATWSCHVVPPSRDLISVSIPGRPPACAAFAG